MLENIEIICAVSKLLSAILLVICLVLYVIKVVGEIHDLCYRKNNSYISKHSFYRNRFDYCLWNNKRFNKKA